MSTLPFETKPDYLDIGGLAGPGETTFTVIPSATFRPRSFQVLTSFDRLFVIAVNVANVSIMAYDPKTMTVRPIDCGDLRDPMAVDAPTVTPANRIAVVVKNYSDHVQGFIGRFHGVILIR